MMKKIYLCFIIVLAFFCVSCSKAPDSLIENEVKTNVQLAEEAIKNASKCFANSKFEDASKYIELEEFQNHIENDLSTDEISAEELIELWLPKVRFEILFSEEVNDNCIESKIKVAALSHKSVLTVQKSLQDSKIDENIYALSNMPEPQRREWVNRAVAEASRKAHFDFEHPLVYSEVICTVKKVDSSWKMDMNTELMNAMLGDEIGAMEEVFGITMMNPKD